MNGKLMYANSKFVTRDQLVTIAAPPPTGTWRPIAHGDLIQAIDRQLLVRGSTIQEEQFATQREGARLFAVLDLSLETTGKFCGAMGIRTANDRSMALEIAVGVRVMVCDNLTFLGDLIALRRKHTAKFDLNADISRAIDRYQAHLLVLQEKIATASEAEVSDYEAKSLIVEAFHLEILPIRYFHQVVGTYFRPSMPGIDLVPRTMWGLHNVFTAAVREMAPAPAFEATIELGKLFGLRADQKEIAA